MGRPSKAMVSKSMAATAALKIIDTRGLEGLNLQLVAQELGVKAPSLYYHFRNRAELLEEVANRLMEHVSAPTPTLRKTTAENWKKILISTCVEIRRAILTHPNATPLILRFFPRHLSLMASDQWMSTYHDVPNNLHLVISDGLEKITFGSILISSTPITLSDSPMPEIDCKEHVYFDNAVKANKLDEEQIFAETLNRFLATF